MPSWVGPAREFLVVLRGGAVDRAALPPEQDPAAIAPCWSCQRQPSVRHVRLGFVEFGVFGKDHPGLRALVNSALWDECRTYRRRCRPSRPPCPEPAGGPVATPTDPHPAGGAHLAFDRHAASENAGNETWLARQYKVPRCNDGNHPEGATGERLAIGAVARVHRKRGAADGVSQSSAGAAAGSHRSTIA